MNDEQKDSSNTPEPTPAPTTQDQLEQLEQASPAEAEPDTVSIPVNTRSAPTAEPTQASEPAEPANLEYLQPSVSDAGTPAVPPTFPEGSQKPHKKGRRVLLIVLIIILAVIVAGLTIYALVFSKPDTKPAKKEQSVSSMNMDDMANMDHAKMLADDAKKLIADKYSADNPNLKLVRKDNDLSPEYKPAGTEFYLSDNIASNLSVDTAGNDALSKQIVATLADYLTSQHLTSKTVTAWDEYQDDIVICTTPVKNMSDSSNPFFLSCANKSAYDEPAASLQPFVNALRASKTAPAEFRSDSVALTGPTVVKDSQTAGYQTVTVGINSYPYPAGGSAGLFYRKGGDWQFFAATQNELPCSDYNTDDLKNAYAGEPCGSADGNTSLTVQPASAVVTPKTQTKTSTSPATKTQSTTSNSTTTQP